MAKVKYYAKENSTIGTHSLQIYQELAIIIKNKEL